MLKDFRKLYFTNAAYIVIFQHSAWYLNICNYLYIWNVERFLCAVQRICKRNEILNVLENFDASNFLFTFTASYFGRK